MIAKKPMTPRASEAEIQAQIIEAAGKWFGIELFHFDAGAVRKATHGQAHGVHGAVPEYWPDLFGVIPPTGRSLHIEVKRPGEEPTPGQLAMLDKLSRRGAAAAWFDDSQKFVFWLQSILTTKGA